jgi:lipopolysaccharide transport system permease protein
MDWLISPFLLAWQHRHLLAATVMSELRATYAGSILGMAWVVIGPVVLLALYTVVYRVIFCIQQASISGKQYVLYVLSGLVAFLTFAGSLTLGATSLIKDRQVLLGRKVRITLDAGLIAVSELRKDLAPKPRVMQTASL